MEGSSTVSVAATTRRLLSGESARLLGMIALLLLFSVAVTIRNPHFLDSSNLKVIFMDTGLLAIAAIAELVVMITGNIDVSSSSIIAVSGFSAALLLKTYSAINPVVGVVLALALGLSMGAFNGLIVGFAKVPAIIVTLGTLSMFRGINFIISGGGWVVSRDLPDSFQLVANGRLFGIPVLIAVAVVVGVVFAGILTSTRVGRYAYAIGSSPENARIVGLNISLLTFAVFCVAGLLFGLCGVLWVSRYNFAQSNTAEGFELTVIAAAVIGGTSVTGGRGKVVGVVLGALLLSLMINAINVAKITPFWRMAIQGAVILTAVIFDSWFARRSTGQA